MSSNPTLEEIAAHLRACEEMLLASVTRRNRVSVAAMLAEDFFEIGASGRHWTREEILELLESEEYSPPSMEDFQCLSIADGVALVTYRTVRLDRASGNQSVTLRSSIWTHENGDWRMRFHQGTRSL